MNRGRTRAVPSFSRRAQAGNEHKKTEDGGKEARLPWKKTAPRGGAGGGWKREKIGKRIETSFTETPGAGKKSKGQKRVNGTILPSKGGP